MHIPRPHVRRTETLEWGPGICFNTHPACALDLRIRVLCPARLCPLPQMLPQQGQTATGELRANSQRGLWPQGVTDCGGKLWRRSWSGVVGAPEEECGSDVGCRAQSGVGRGYICDRSGLRSASCPLGAHSTAQGTCFPGPEAPGKVHIHPFTLGGRNLTCYLSQGPLHLKGGAQEKAPFGKWDCKLWGSWTGSCLVFKSHFPSDSLPGTCNQRGLHLPGEGWQGPPGCGPGPRSRGIPHLLLCLLASPTARLCGREAAISITGTDPLCLHSRL